MESEGFLPHSGFQRWWGKLHGNSWILEEGGKEGGEEENDRMREATEWKLLRDLQQGFKAEDLRKNYTGLSSVLHPRRKTTMEPNISVAKRDTFGVNLPHFSCHRC